MTGLKLFVSILFALCILLSQIPGRAFAYMNEAATFDIASQGADRYAVKVNQETHATFWVALYDNAAGIEGTPPDYINHQYISISVGSGGTITGVSCGDFYWEQVSPSEVYLWAEDLSTTGAVVTVTGKWDSIGWKSVSLAGTVVFDDWTSASDGDSMDIATVDLSDVTVAGAALTNFAGTYTTVQAANQNVTLTAVLDPSVDAAIVPADLVSWTNGNAGANALERLVSRTNPTDTTVTAQVTASINRRIIVRKLGGANGATNPTSNPTINNNAGNNTCAPNRPTIDWEVVSVAGDNNWHVRVKSVNCTGQINIRPWPSKPNAIVVPNTANPVVGGNINNVAGSANLWSAAVADMGDYNTVGGGAGPNWHSTAASSAHEMFHWNTDWMTSSLGAAGGNWGATETALEGLTVSALAQLTEADAKAALTKQVDDRFKQFGTAAINYWNNTIAPADQPGLGGGGYAAGQGVLNGLIANVNAFAAGQGW
jgi:hypothetical protein